MIGKVVRIGWKTRRNNVFCKSRVTPLRAANVQCGRRGSFGRVRPEGFFIYLAKLSRMKNYYRRLCRQGYGDQVDKILAERNVDYDRTYLGFLEIYDHLAQIIPPGRTVVDLGCASAFQAAFFVNHKKYIGIDHSIPLEYRLHTKNSEHHMAEIDDYLSTAFIMHQEYGELFGILNYVPLRESTRMRVGVYFRDVFMFYPSNKFDRPLDADPWKVPKKQG